MTVVETVVATIECCWYRHRRRVVGVVLKLLLFCVVVVLVAAAAVVLKVVAAEVDVAVLLPFYPSSLIFHVTFHTPPSPLTGVRARTLLHFIIRFCLAVRLAASLRSPSTRWMSSKPDCRFVLH